MKLQKIRTRILLPAVIVFLLLPPLSCLIFQWAARQYAYEEAAENLELLQQNLLPIMAACFENAPEIGIRESDPDPSAANPDLAAGPVGNEIPETNQDTVNLPNSVPPATYSDRYTANTPSTRNGDSAPTDYRAAIQKTTNENAASAPKLPPVNRAPQNAEGSSTTETVSNKRPVDSETNGDESNEASTDIAASRPRTGTTQPNSTSEAPSNGTRPRKGGTRTSSSGTMYPRQNRDNADVSETSETETAAPAAQQSLPGIQLLRVSSTSNIESDTSGTNEIETNPSAPASFAQIQTFLRQVSNLMRRMGGNAELIILESKMQVVYPRDEQAREEIAPFAADVRQYIEGGEFSLKNGTIEFTASDGSSYLLNIYEAPTKSQRIKYLVAYSSTDKIGNWVRDASILMLAISFFFVLAALLIFGLTAHSITHPLHRLCREAERIGNGKFYEIEPSFSLMELEELRFAMNRMSDQLERADRQQRDFFQNVSHDLRNPLMSISGYAQGIEQGVFRAPEEAARTILEESTRLTELVNRLLTLSRLETMQSASKPETICAASLLEDCMDRFYGLAMKKGITLALTPVDETLSVCGEEELFGQVMDNLLSNAIRYAKTTVLVETSAEKECVRITVADDGDGIAEQDLPHVFERSYKGKGGNYGIGLAIAQAAVQKMGGQLEAANRSQGGAVFIVTLKSRL